MNTRKDNVKGHLAEAGPVRFYSLDVLRSIAALSVVFCHWRLLFEMSGVETINRSSFPFWQVLSPLYLKGQLAVDLFFSLSGFIFFWLYSRSVAGREISAWHFSVLRFSRLYPLHLLTLLVAALAHYAFFALHGRYYLPSDTMNFLLNLAFINAWGFGSDFSFNAPAWSVSIEVLLYAVFFLYCRFLPLRFGLLVAASVLGFVLVGGLNATIGRGIGSFFLGGATFLAYEHVRRRGTAQWHLRYLKPATLLLWCMFIIWFSFYFEHTWISLGDTPILWRFDSVEGILSCVLLFPPTILALALSDMTRGQVGVKWSWLGDISYSSYMIHFPLMFAVALILTVLEIDSGVFYSTWFMIAFFATLIALSLLSYRFFEAPVQRWFRRRSRPQASNRAVVRPAD
jgi:peptidoglycan/LPS O-acetylase OafA/YrhL